MCFSLEKVFLFRASCLTRMHRGLIFHLFHILNALVLLPLHSDEQPLDPRTAERSGRLAILSPLTGYEPNTTVEISSTEITLFIYHQGVEAAAHFLIPVRPPQLHLRLRKWMEDKALEGWLHRCSCSREKQVQSPQGFVTLQEKIPRHIHLTLRAQGDLLQHTHTHKRKSSRDTRSVQERHLTSERIRSQQQEVRDFLKFRTDEAVGKLYQNSLKRSFIRDCSLKSKEIRFLETKCEKSAWVKDGTCRRCHL